VTTEKDPLDQLREPFPKNVVGILPKPYKKDSPKGQCRDCGGFHGLPAAHLDFVGHAAVTDRLLSVDPEWTWEPMHRRIDPAVLQAALASGNPECVALVIKNSPPALDADGNLWIYLTVCGITRPGVGDGFSMKERIGDAIRNAAMRFGVALSLWTKDELESGYVESKPELSAPTPISAGTSTGLSAPLVNAAGGDIDSMDLRTLTMALEAAGLPLSGNTDAKRARLAEHRLSINGSSSNRAVAVAERNADPETGELPYDAAPAPPARPAAAASSARVYLNVPFKDKDAAKAAGAKWDKNAPQPGSDKSGRWYIPEGADPLPLMQWVEDETAVVGSDEVCTDCGKPATRIEESQPWCDDCVLF